MTHTEHARDPQLPPRRFVLSSMQGGVGRSTTTMILARHLAHQGKHVLVIDLDLDSPGVGLDLLGSRLPRFGIIDGLVDGDAVIPGMVGVSPIREGSGGRVSVVPVFGSDTVDYLFRLGVVRGALGTSIRWLLPALEAQEAPDVVLVDVGAGLHHASVLIPSLGADTLLFAQDTRQTWATYDLLFQHLARHHDVRSFRDRLWMVASMVPMDRVQSYVDGMVDECYELFVGSVYEPVPADVVSSPDVFSFAATDEVGNHFPRIIIRDGGLVGGGSDASALASHGMFLDWFDRVLM